MVDQDIREDDLSDKEMSQQEVYSMYKEETMAELKQLKAQAKTVFTKTRRTLLVTIQQEKVSTCEIKEACEALDTAQEEAMEAMARLLNKYIAEKDYKSSEKISQEIEKSRSSTLMHKIGRNRVLMRLVGVKVITSLLKNWSRPRKSNPQI